MGGQIDFGVDSDACTSACQPNFSWTSKWILTMESYSSSISCSGNFHKI